MRGRKRETASWSSPPARGREGRGGGEGARERSRGRGRGPRQKGPRPGVSDQTDGKGWRLEHTESQAQRPEAGGGGGEGTRANEGSGSSARSSGRRKRKRRWGCEGTERAWGGEHPGGAHISTHVRAGTRTHAHPGVKLYTPSPLAGLCFSSVGARCFRLAPPPSAPSPGPRGPSPSRPDKVSSHLRLSPYRPLGVVVAPRLRAPHWGGGRPSLLP